MKKIKQKKTLALLIILVLFGFSFLGIHFANAGGDSVIKIPFNWLLLGFLKVSGLALSLSATLFAWIIDPKNVKLVIDNAVIYKTWAMVRDMLNIAFILVLLFSAFATIFQVANYNYKKILLNLVIMALLVNFSYPIARFLVDVGNVVMYSIVNNLGILDGGSPFTVIADNSSLDKIINPKGEAANDTTFLIMAVIFTFILAVTFLIIAFLFVIRTVALAVLIIFSPIAFVGSIISLLEPFSKKWWTNIWNYSIFGATMTFMIYVAVEMTKIIGTTALGEEGRVSMKAIAVQNSTADPGFIAAASFFAIPIVILWMGIAAAKQAGVVGADLAVGTGTKFMKWAGRTLTGYRGGRYMAKRAWESSGIPGGYKAKLQEFKKRGFFGTDRQSEREAWISEKGPGLFLGKKKGAISEANRSKIQKIRDDWKKQGGLSENELLDDIINNESKPEILRQAAAIEFSDKYSFSGDKAYKNYETVMGLVGKDGSLKKAVNDNVKKKRLDLMLNYDINNPEKGKTSKEVAYEKLEGLQVDDYKNIDLKSFFENSKEKGFTEKVTKEYFKNNISDERKVEIAKKISGKNEKILESFPTRGSSKGNKAGFV